MVTWKSFCLTVLLAGSLAGVGSAQTTQTADQTQPQAGATGAPVTTVDQAIDRVIAREHEEIATIRRFNPVIETYIQDMKPDKDMGAVPVRDHYFLGRQIFQRVCWIARCWRPRRAKWQPSTRSRI